MPRPLASWLFGSSRLQSGLLQLFKHPSVYESLPKSIGYGPRGGGPSISHFCHNLAEK